jgi:hypothetical protein
MDPHERPVVTDDNKVAMRAGSIGNNVLGAKPPLETWRRLVCSDATSHLERSLWPFADPPMLIE